MTVETTTTERTKQIHVIEAVRVTVAEEYGFSPEELNTPRRTKVVAEARHVAMFLVRELCAASFPDIAKAFGKADHMSAMHAIKVVNTRSATVPKFKTRVTRLRGIAKRRISP